MKIFLSLLLFLTMIPASAEIYTPHRFVILLVGISPDELAEHEHKILQGKQVIQVAQTDDWKKAIYDNSAQEIIVKQNSGFVGLYTPNGSLVRSMDLVGNENPVYDENPIAYPVRDVSYQEVNDYGYVSGGRPDPYQPVAVYEPKNNARLNPGWGYNSELQHPKRYKRSAWGDFLNFFPIDTVTPFNYPGTFDQTGIAPAYGLGVIPHIGGLVAARNRAKAEKENYDYYRNLGPQEHIEAPVRYYKYNRGEPDNPISSDPNFIRYQNMPQAFNQNYPGYSTHVYGAH